MTKEAEYARAAIAEGPDDLAAPGPRGDVAGQVRGRGGARRLGAAPGGAAPAAGAGTQAPADPRRAVPAPAGAAVRMNRPMPARVEFDFRHGLAEPTITRDDDGEPVVVLVHRQDRVRIAL